MRIVIIITQNDKISYPNALNFTFYVLVRIDNKNKYSVYEIMPLSRRLRNI